MNRRVRGITGNADAAVLRGYLRQHLAVASVLGVAAAVALVVAVGSVGTLRRVEARSMPLPGIVVEHLPPSPDGWERLRVTYPAPDEEVQAAVAVADGDSYRIGQRVDVLVDPRLPAQPVLASELPEPWLPGIAAGIALVASVAIAVRSTKWVRRLERLVCQRSHEAVMWGQLCASGHGAWLALSEARYPGGTPAVYFPLMASQQELVERDHPCAVTVRWDLRDPAVMVAIVGGRVLWARGRARLQHRAAVTPPSDAPTTAEPPAEGSDGSPSANGALGRVPGEGEPAQALKAQTPVGGGGRGQVWETTSVDANGKHGLLSHGRQIGGLSLEAAHGPHSRPEHLQRGCRPEA